MSNRSWRREAFRSELKAMIDIEQVTPMECFNVCQELTGGSCYCHAWCDCCGDEVWVPAMRYVNVVFEGDSFVFEGRLKTLHLCVECLEIAQKEVDEKEIPTVKEPEVL